MNVRQKIAIRVSQFFPNACFIRNRRRNHSALTNRSSRVIEAPLAFARAVAFVSRFPTAMDPLSLSLVTGRDLRIYIFMKFPAAN